jgi:hypothetical protein
MERTFNIKVTMEERWINDFCSMMHWMQCCGDLGHSSVVGFYVDGDGDFRPKFEIDTDYEKTKGFWKADGKQLPDIEVLFDAG